MFKRKKLNFFYPQKCPTVVIMTIVYNFFFLNKKNLICSSLIKNVALSQQTQKKLLIMITTFFPWLVSWECRAGGLMCICVCVGLGVLIDVVSPQSSDKMKKVIYDLAKTAIN